MKKPNVLLIAAICTVTLAAWALMGIPVSAPAWSGKLHGYAFSPLRAEHDPANGRLPTATQIDADLALLAPHARAVRSYTVKNVFARLPAMAKRHGLAVTLGAWLDGNEQHDRAELARLVEVTASASNVERVMVGNETLLRETLTLEQLLAHLDLVRTRVEVPVSTAEPWHVWLQHPRLAEHVDVITVHVLPFWEGVPVDVAVDFLAERMAELRAAFPNKPLVIGEVGWPSRGRSRGEAVASHVNQALFVRHFLARTDLRDTDYFLLEAFDQPWKRAIEGDVGAYWGLYDVDRRPRFPFAGPIEPLPHWPALALLSALIAVGSFWVLTRDSEGLRLPGRLWLATMTTSLGSALVWAARDQAGQYWTPPSATISLLMAAGAIAILAVLLTELHEWVEARWAMRRRAPAPVPRPAGADTVLPMVSIHVPAHNEPSDMLAATLQALAALDYPDYEVLLVDNNTSDPNCWRPIQSLCARLGPRFRFFHVEGLKGYKAGALNFALERTAAEAELIAVVDSDYQVQPHWLRATVGYFTDPATAIVQAPQDYRDTDASLFKAACTAEYATFFHAGMVTRNERNAIIQHGTMTLVRKHVLGQVGDWGEWTITEDAELGLRILARGYDSWFVADVYGRGLSPDNFQDYKTQRFRWVFGAVQILRAQAGALLGRRQSRLTRAQRYHFLAGWLPWLADGLNLLVSVVAIAWSLLMLLFPARLDVPEALYTAPALLLFTLRLAKALDLQRACVGTGFLRALQGATAGLALTYTVGRAVLSAVCHRAIPFVRTPKLAPGHSVAAALVSVRGEALLAAALLLCAISVGYAVAHAGVEATLWRALLLALALPHLAAVVLAILGALPPRAGNCTDPSLGNPARVPTSTGEVSGRVGDGPG